MHPFCSCRCPRWDLRLTLAYLGQMLHTGPASSSAKWDPEVPTSLGLGSPVQHPPPAPHPRERQRAAQASYLFTRQRQFPKYWHRGPQGWRGEEKRRVFSPVACPRQRSLPEHRGRVGAKGPPARTRPPPSQRTSSMAAPGNHLGSCSIPHRPPELGASVHRPETVLMGPARALGFLSTTWRTTLRGWRDLLAKLRPRWRTLVLQPRARSARPAGREGRGGDERGGEGGEGRRGEGGLTARAAGPPGKGRGASSGGQAKVFPPGPGSLLGVQQVAALRVAAVHAGPVGLELKPSDLTSAACHPCLHRGPGTMCGSAQHPGYVSVFDPQP